MPSNPFRGLDRAVRARLFPGTGRQRNADFATLFSGSVGGVDAARRDIATRTDDISRRLASGPLADAVAEAARLDPLVLSPDGGLARPVFPTVANHAIRSAAVLKRLHASVGHRPRSAVIAVGGGETLPDALDQFVVLLQDAYGADNVIILATDKPTLSRQSRGQIVDFASLAEPLSARHGIVVLTTFLRTLAPDLIVVAGSAAMRTALTESGPVLARMARLFLLIEGSDTASDATTRDVYRCVDSLSGILVDDPDVAETLVARFLLPDGVPRLSVLPVVGSAARSDAIRAALGPEDTA